MTPARYGVEEGKCGGRSLRSRHDKERPRASQRDIDDETLVVDRPPRVALRTIERIVRRAMRVRADARADRSAAQRAAEPRARGQLGARGRELACFTERAQHAVELPARRAGGRPDDRSDEQSLTRPTLRRSPRR